MEKKFRNLEEKIKDKIYQDGLITIEENEERSKEAFQRHAFLRIKNDWGHV